jgi:hypothetical protein
LLSILFHVILTPHNSPTMDGNSDSICAASVMILHVSQTISGMVARFLTLLLIFLILAHVTNQAVNILLDRSYGLYMFDMGRERSIPTFLSSIGLMTCSLLLGLIARIKKRDGTRIYLYWVGLSLVFLALAMDEFIMIHEGLSAPARLALNTSEFLDLAWVIPYGLFVVVFAAIYLKFILDLPPRTRLQCIVAGLFYVVGAIGLELVSGSQEALRGKSSLAYIASVLAEETFEMVGIAIFLYALVAYIHTEIGGFNLRIASESS